MINPKKKADKETLCSKAWGATDSSSLRYGSAKRWRASSMVFKAKSATSNRKRSRPTVQQLAEPQGDLEARQTGTGETATVQGLQNGLPFGEEDARGGVPLICGEEGSGGEDPGNCFYDNWENLDVAELNFTQSTTVLAE